MLWWFAQTTLIAGALAVVATLAGRWKRLGPEARHALWLLVLIKLAIPPFIAWPWSVPDSWPASARIEPLALATSVPAPVALPEPPIDPVPIPRPDALPPTLPGPPTVAGPPPSPEDVPVRVEIPEELPVAAVPDPLPIEPPRIIEPAPTPRARTSEISNRNSPIWTWESALIAAWLAGSVVVVARRGFKVVRFHRSLADSRPAPDWLVDETRAIGDRVGVRPPLVVATPWVATPLLWCLGRPRLVLPEILIKRLGVDRWPGILAHELAHLARGDHWVVRLELLVEAAWWWNPLFWLARRKLHEQAKIACDARVVRSLPERRYAYAEALVDVCEHIARSAIPSPSLGVGGAGAAHSLEGRLDMILRDPIPRRPSRRAALLAVLLAALALPAWTLGQQPEPPQAKPDALPSKPEAPASAPVKEQAPDAPAPKPAEAPAAEFEAPRPVELAANEEPASIEAIRDAQKGKWKKLDNLSFRLVVADRERSRSEIRATPLAGANGVTFKEGSLIGIARSTRVVVKVADVVLGAQGRSRSDVLAARPMPEGPADPAGPPRPPVAWGRRFAALDGEGYTALEMAWDKSGPVPFRRLGTREVRQAFGDSLTSAFFRGPNNGVEAFHSSDLDRQFEPLDPRPRNALELYGVPTFLKAELARAEVLGVDMVDGRHAVRIAWSATADVGLRGLCWAAPELGYAVVLLNATQDPAPDTAAARRSWQRRSSDFVKVTDHLWLPRKVTFEEALLDPAGGEPTLRREREMAFEGYRVDEPTRDDTFRPRLPIRDLDNRSGNFTADPPAIPAGLVDRLARAVAESKFGPPAVETTVEEPRAVATRSNASQRPGGQQSNKSGDQQPGKSNTQTPRLAIKPGDPVDDPAKGDPRIIAKPAPGFEDPIPTVAPKVDDPISAKAPAGRSEIDRAIERRFKLDPEVIELSRQMALANTKANEARRFARSVDDPAVKVARRKVDNIKAQYEQLWEEKSRKFRTELGPELDWTRDEIEVLQARRDGRAAEVRKAEAQRDLAAVERDNTLKLVKQGGVSNRELALYEAKLNAAEAEVEGKKAELAEADALLNQAKRRLGIATAARPAPEPLARDPKDADRGAGAQDAREEVALAQARRDGKAAEVRRAEAVLERAGKDMARANALLARSAIGQQEVDQITTDLKLAEADVAGKKAELAEADILLNQVKRRLPGPSAASQGPSSSGERPSTQAELRDAIELLEVQLQGKQAEMRRAEAIASQTRIQAANTKKLADRGGVSANEVQLFDDKARADQAALEARKAEVLEVEVRIKQAKRRLDPNESRPRREVERMPQLDPKFVPVPPAEAPKPDDQPRKEDDGPRLSVKLVGEKARVLGQGIDYKLTVSNPGMKAARHVKVVASLPQQGGKLNAVPPDARFDPATRELTWSIAELGPANSVELSFLYGTTTPGTYRATVEATSGETRANDSLETDVSAVALRDVQVSQDIARVIDLGKTTSYDIVIKNSGTKDATKLRLTGKLDNLKLLPTFIVEKGGFPFNPNTGEFFLDEIERLGAGLTTTIRLEVQADGPGQAGCHVFLSHAEMGPDEPPIEDVISTTIAGKALAKPEAMRLDPRSFSYLIGAFW
jgi:beta-lactamase regulating signal transducer with metallopeptidase domain/multidrug resistance efflux pump